MTIPTVLQSATDIIPTIPTGQAIIYVGLVAVLTILAFRLMSALILFAWSLAIAFLIFAFLGWLGIELFWLIMIFAALSVGATSLYTASNA
jgi:hypothetical protein